MALASQACIVLNIDIGALKDNRLSNMANLKKLLTVFSSQQYLGALYATHQQQVLEHKQKNNTIVLVV